MLCCIPFLCGIWYEFHNGQLSKDPKWIEHTVFYRGHGLQRNGFLSDILFRLQKLELFNELTLVIYFNLSRVIFLGSKSL